jgi:tetratricopeptide (TPR) repeat protein
MRDTQSRIKKYKKLASEFIKLNEPEKAFPLISEVMNVNFDDPDALMLAGTWFRKKGHPGLATQFFRRAAALRPDKINPWLLFGACLHDCFFFDEAMQCFQRARQINPDEPAAFANMAASHVQMGEFADAFSYATEALKRDPTHKTALACRGMACLGLGRWKEGFKDYKHIYGDQVIIRVYRQPEEPEWDGTKGKTVVVQSDQGLGDEIRYASILQSMVKDCKKVILDCHPKLEKVFKRAFPEIDVYGTKKQNQGVKWVDNYEIDAHYHISGLGRFYRTRDKDFPRKPYLIPNPELVEKWRETLKDLPKPWVGIAWQGGLVGTGREFRSTDLAQWEPMISQGGTFVDLSYHDSAEEVEKSGISIFRPEINQSDYDDTLALLEALDLVVCVPTTVLHAAGAINKQAWVLVPRWTHWEFGKTREDMIWYPKGVVKLFRSKSQDLVDTIQQMSDAYGEFLSASGFHRNRPETGNRVYRPATLHLETGEQANSDNTPRITAVTNYSKRTNGVHF